MAVSSLETGSMRTVSFVERTGDKEARFRLPATSEEIQLDDRVLARRLKALLGGYVSGAVSDVSIERREQGYVEGRAQVKFPHAMYQDNDAQVSQSHAFRCSGASDFLFTAGAPGRRRNPDDGPIRYGNHVLH